MSEMPNERYFENLGPLQGGSDVSGKRPQFTNSCGLEDVLAAYDDLLLMPDHGGVSSRSPVSSPTTQPAMPSGRCSSVLRAAGSQS